MKRGAQRNKDCELIAAWVPKDLIARIDAHVEAEDTDRSKWIRDAIRRKCEGFGITLAPARLSGGAKSVATTIVVAAIVSLMALSAHAPECGDDQGTLPVMATSAE